MKTFKLIAITTAAAIPALAAYSATGPAPVHTLAELSAGERGTDIAELSERERGGIDNPTPWKSAELSQQERGTDIA